MGRRVDGLPGVPELLVELLARARADELDLDVGLPGEADHVLGQLDDLHGLAHVEDVDLAAPADRPAWTTSDAASGIVMK